MPSAVRMLRFKNAVLQGRRKVDAFIAGPFSKEAVDSDRPLRPRSVLCTSRFSCAAPTEASTRYFSAPEPARSSRFRWIEWG